MGLTFRYLMRPDASNPVLDWFRHLERPPCEYPAADGVTLHFASLGPIAWDDHKERITGESPVATVYFPEVRRSVLWTVGEIHFLSAPISRFPVLKTIAKKCHAWLKQQELIYEQFRDSDDVSEWDYYLEGSIKNFDAPIYGFPEAVSALQSGQYFISREDVALDSLCKKLRLRGVECGPA